MSKTTTPHPFTPNPMRGGQVNWSECGHCWMPDTHRVHNQPQRIVIKDHAGNVIGHTTSIDEDETGTRFQGVIRADGPPMTDAEWEPFAKALDIR